MPRVSVTVVVLHGGYAQLVVPSHRWTPQNPLLVPASDITDATGLDRAQLPGLEMTADVTETAKGGTIVRGYRAA